jgi:hypothetical protein
MDRTASHYRDRAAEKQRYADEMLPGAARDNVVAMMAEYEKKAAALDTVAPADRAHPKHPTI